MTDERGGSVTSGPAFRAAVAAILIFVTVLAAVGIVIVQFARATMVMQLESQIAEETELFRDIYERGGQEALEEAVGTLTPARIAEQHVFGLFSTDGERRAGTLQVAPDVLGWSTLRDAGTLTAGGIHARATNAGLGDNVLVVGRTLNFVRETIRRLVFALITGGLLVCATTALIGYAIGCGTLRRLEGMADALEAVSEGQAGARLPVGSGRDQIGRVAALMNVHLDRLERLMATTRAAASAMAHELRGPLHRAYIALQSADSPGLGDAELHERMAVASDELLALDRMFDTILRIARIEAGKGQVALEPVAIGPLVADIAETYEAVLEDAGLTLLVENDADAGTVAGDANMIRQILVNLLENAVRYVPPGSTVTLAIEPSDEIALVSVADDGPGIPEADREHATQPFRQVSPSGAGKSAGVGLGLALVRAIVDYHHGSLRLSDNQPGLRVEIALPRAVCRISGAVHSNGRRRRGMRLTRSAAAGR